MDAILTDFSCYDIPAPAAISANFQGQLPRYASPVVASPLRARAASCRLDLGALRRWILSTRHDEVPCFASPVAVGRPASERARAASSQRPAAKRGFSRRVWPQTPRGSAGLAGRAGLAGLAGPAGPAGSAVSAGSAGFDGRAGRAGLGGLLQIFTGYFPGTLRQSLPRRYEHGLPAADSTWALFAAEFCRLGTTRSPASLRPSRSAGRLASEHGQPSSQRPAAKRGFSRRVWPQTPRGSAGLAGRAGRGGRAGLAGLARVCTLVFFFIIFFFSPHLPALLPIVCDGQHRPVPAMATFRPTATFHTAWE